MQAYTSPLEYHTRMTDLAMDLLNSGHEFYAGAIASLAYNFQKDNDVEIETRAVQGE